MSNPLFACRGNSTVFSSIVIYFPADEKADALSVNSFPGVTTSYSLPSCCIICFRSEGVTDQATMYTFKNCEFPVPNVAFRTMLTALATLSSRPGSCIIGTPEMVFQLDYACPEPLST